MNQYSGLKELIVETIETAIDDLTAGTDSIRFDVERLARVMKGVGTADRYNAAVAVCDEQMYYWITKAGDAQGDRLMFGRARAALALQKKITAPPNRGYRPDGSGGFKPIE